jgi:prepilin-type processing-associated H-X9-DG protein
MKMARLYLKKWDVAVGILCAAFTLLTLGAAGESGRKRAKEAVCQANLNQWGRYFRGYIEQNDGEFFTGDSSGYWWPWQLPHDVQDWKKNRTWFCPTATSPRIPDTGVIPATLSTYNAWGIESPATTNAPASIQHQGQTYTINPNGVNGSFGLNGYMLSIPKMAVYLSGMRAGYGWQDPLHVANADTVPMFLDAVRFDGWPIYTDSPPETENSASLVYPGIGRYCIDRHDGAVNCLFLDGSVRKVGLKELWTLRWHQRYMVSGPWTKAGGALPGDWPQWMKPFKEY